MTLIADEAKATEDKTARLRALRLERDATVVPDAPAPSRKTAAKRATRR